MSIPVRMAVMAALAALMAGTPAYKQVLGGKGPFPQWRMFTSIYAQQCEVAFYRRDDGVDTRIDRLAALGHVPWTSAPRDALFLKTEAAVRAQAATLCRRLQTDLRADVRCGSFHGWEPVMARETNLCAGETP